jgi:hypothetical protein
VRALSPSRGAAIMLVAAVACAEGGSGFSDDDESDDGGNGGSAGGLLPGGMGGTSSDGGGGDGGAGLTGPCGGTLTLCGSECVNVETNEAHCGGCDMPCDPGEECVDEQCGGAATCGDGVLEASEERDPPSSSFSTLSVDGASCRWDLAGVTQLYCNGGCSWGGPDDCDQADADIFCKLTQDDPASTATSFEVVQVMNAPGFACSLSPPSSLGTLSSRGVSVPVAYQDAPLPTTHGSSGQVITNVVCR